MIEAVHSHLPAWLQGADDRSSALALPNAGPADTTPQAPGNPAKTNNIRIKYKDVSENNGQGYQPPLLS